MTLSRTQELARPVLLATALLALAAAPACFRRPVRDYACPVPDASAAATSPAVWDCNRAIIRRVLRGRSFSLREYQASAAYFERLTGVPAGSRQTRQGEVPDPAALRDAAERWDAWRDERRGEDDSSGTGTGTGSTAARRSRGSALVGP